MGRRSDHSRDELASLVIEAARSIVAAEGTRGVTMRRIAKRIGYAAGSIYNAVGDSDEVLLRVNAGTLTRLGETLEAAVNVRAGTDPLAAAILIAEAYMDFVASNRRLWTAVLEHPGPSDVSPPDWYVRRRDRPLEIVAAVIGPLFPDEHARRRAVIALWAALQGVASLEANGNLKFMLPQSNGTEIARSIVLRYLTGNEDRSTHVGP